jgi:thymidylate synthase (FAD)
MKKIDVLDGGYVAIHEDGVMGSDKTIVNAARVSYGKRVDGELEDKDRKLIRFLAKHGHTSPFRHATLQFECRVPLMIARQWWKYIVGAGFQDPMTAWNESSRRYITERNEYHLPDYFRLAPENSKQGSGKPVDDETNERWLNLLATHQIQGESLYQQAMADGICAEQARLFLPAYGLYVTFYWTASLQGVAHLLNQRLESDAQFEFQAYAKAVHTLASEHFPISLEELLINGE